MIYVHIPFCRSFCNYCGFFSVLEQRCSTGSEEKMKRYVSYLCKEIETRKSDILQTLNLNTLYLGGGTPSVLPLYLLEEIIQALHDFSPFVEFTIEVNPDDIVEKGREYVEELLKLGVNRISMGVQSFNDDILKWMNRRHNVKKAKQAFSYLRNAGIDNISIDLIFGISGMSDDMWKDTVLQAIDLVPEHISAYQLSIEEGSVLSYRADKGLYQEVSEMQSSIQYDTLCDLLNKAGYNHYEVSNFALSGKEAIHNSGYWKRVPYVGFGASAHSFIGKHRMWNTNNVPFYTGEYEELTPEDERVEKLMLSLRTSQGIEESYLINNCSKNIIDKLFNSDSLVRVGRSIRIPEKRFFVSDDIIRELI